MKKLLVIFLAIVLNPLIYIQSANAEVTVSHLIGVGGMGNTDGGPTVAKFNRPADVAIDNQGNSYVLDNNGIRKITSSGIVTTLYKPSLTSTSSAGNYCGITIDKDQNIWFGDCRRSFVYKISNTGLLLKTVNLPYPQSSWMNVSPGLDSLPDGSILVSVWYEGKILKITSDGVVSIYYQSQVTTTCNTSPRPVGIFCPMSLTTSPSGEVYVVNQGYYGNEVLQILSSNSTSKIMTPNNPTNVEFTNGSLYVSVGDTSMQQEWQLHKISSGGSYQLMYRKIDANRWSANGFKILPGNILIVTSYDNNAIRKINLNTNSENIIGNVSFGDSDGDISNSSTQSPAGIAEDLSGNIYFIDYKGVRKISKSGIVSTIYKGSYLGYGSLIFQDNRLHFIESNFLRVIDLNGNLQRTVNLNVTGDYPVMNSNTIAVNKSGQIYVIMYKRDDYNSKYLRKIEVNGASKDIPLVLPNYAEIRIAFNKDDSLVMAHTGQIRKYSNDNLNDGTYIGAYAGYSLNLFINSSGDLFVFSRDQYASILNLIKSNGITENIINGAADSSTDDGIASGFSSVNGLLVSTNGQIYLSDTGNNSIRFIKISNSSTSGQTGNSNSTTPNQNEVLKRKARSNSSWSRPADLLPGLSEVRYKGYFNDDMKFFNNDAVRTLISNTPSGQLPIWYDSTVMGTEMSIYWGGYFIPDETGNWDFQITSDDASFAWIGNEAVSKYWSGYAASLIALPGNHGPQTKSNSITLEANKIYPFRIFYGNQGGPAGSFKLEIKPPSFKSTWDTNLEGLIWHSDFSNTEDCTNFGISYILSAKLGYDIIDVPACKNNPAKLFTKNDNSNSNSNLTPPAPTLNKISISGNTINLSVNIGTGSNKPDKVYILAPQLGVTANNSASIGKVSGSTATWKIPISSTAAGKSADIQVISTKNGVNSAPLRKTVNIPAAKKGPTTIKVPTKPAPTVKTVICKKGSQTRTFAGNSCPPGWN